MTDWVMVLDLTQTPGYGEDYHFGPMTKQEAQDMIDRAKGTLRERSYTICPMPKVSDRSDCQ